MSYHFKCTSIQLPVGDAVKAARLAVPTES
jgi:hypothetical protein